MGTGRVAAVLCIVSGCAADPPPEQLVGFSPPAPSADEVQYLSPIVRGIRPGEDRIICSYLDAYVGEDLDIARVSGFVSTGGHHIALYAASFVQSPNTHDCKDEEMVSFSYVGDVGEIGGQPAVTEESLLPDGLVRRLKRGSQLVIQSHWLNASDAPLDGQAAFNVRYEPASPAKTPTDFMAVMNTAFDVTPGRSRASVECTFEDTVNVWQVAGHQHDLGTHVRVAFTPHGGSERVLIDDDWQREWSFNPPFVDMMSAPMVVRPGDKLTVDCEWSNPGQDTVHFPSEMCGAIAQYFPSTTRLVCLNGDWLGG